MFIIIEQMSKPLTVSFVVSIWAILSALVLSAPEIRLSVGRVQGRYKLAKDSRKPYVAFYGIPYAKPPVGKLRFKPPEPFVGRGRNVVISSDNFRSSCFTASQHGSVAMSEDCLHLNIFTPHDVSTRKKVMFWIHGGSFLNGYASQYVPSQLVTDKDVIVVTIQYRLGLFGFLTSQIGDANNGLRDQILALKWTKNNIKAFGGDPNDITIFGESAGAASVSFLSLSPLTKGLFTKAILQSGTALSFLFLNRKPSVALNSVAQKLNCANSRRGLISRFMRNQNSDLMNCIRRKTVDELQAVNKQTPNANRVNSTDTMFLPVIDGHVIPKSPEILLADPTYLRKNGVLSREYMVGVNNNEGLFIFTWLLKQEYIYSFTAQQSAESFVKRVYSAFPNFDQRKLWLLNEKYTYPRGPDNHIPIQKLVDFAGDAMFVVPTVQFVRALRKASKSTKLYLYMFDHYPQLLHPNGILRGSAHGLDLAYEFDPSTIISMQTAFYALPPKPSERKLTDMFLTALSQFAKTGSPEGPKGQQPQNWPQYDLRDEYFFRLSMDPMVDRHIFRFRMDLWTDFVLKTTTR